ncbi:MAG: SH3 domain-containing protein [Treponema sp.]|jgi:hypothetical protein|nr:SH3 domain-containing protein [Treponema sp.]
MYSGSNKRLFAGAFCAALVLCAIPAHAQSLTRVPMDMLRTMMYGYFTYVPQAEFNRVFNNFVATTYNGRTYIYDYEAERFSESFGLHVYGGSVAAAWKTYERQANEKARAQRAAETAEREAARAEREKEEARVAAERETARVAAEREAARAATAAAHLKNYPHRLTANAKLYADQDFNATVAANLSRGAAVHIDGYGEYTDLDGDTAKWARVTTDSGQTGWVFSGFLEERPK